MVFQHRQLRRHIRTRKQVDVELREEFILSLRIDIHKFIHAVFGRIPRLDALVLAVFVLISSHCTRRSDMSEQGFIKKHDGLPIMSKAKDGR